LSTDSARRQTYPIGLASLPADKSSRRFAFADSQLRKYVLQQHIVIIAAPRRGGFTYTFAGVTLAAPLNLSQQQASPYTINGRRNLLADYLPTAHLRKHFDRGWDLLIDLAPLQPQYPRSTVIDSTGGDSSSISPFQGYRQYNVYTLKKLFYSDLSVGLYHNIGYSNIWLGGGLTYGRLLGAVGDREMLMKATNPGVNDTTINAEIVSIKSNDTAYKRLSLSDWRYFVEAQYFIYPFTLGLRYERAINSYLPLQADGSRGTHNNQSFTLRLSYELWRRRR
jgi:hypothetical protein